MHLNPPELLKAVFAVALGFLEVMMQHNGFSKNFNILAFILGVIVYYTPFILNDLALFTISLALVGKLIVLNELGLEILDNALVSIVLALICEVVVIFDLFEEIKERMTNLSTREVVGIMISTVLFFVVVAMITALGVACFGWFCGWLGHLFYENQLRKWLARQHAD